MDTPNANMAFELGYALGLGKPYTLATVHGAPPDWLAGSMLRDVLVNVGAEDLGVLLRLLGDTAWAPNLAAGAVGRGARVVLPGTSTASTPRVQLGKVFVRLDVCELEGRRSVEKLAAGELTLREFVQSAKHAALLGEPGAGKTTLLRQLACTLAEAWSGITGLRAALEAHADVWLLLDGMDEVGKSRMASLREQNEAFVRARPGVRAVVSGRPIVDSLRVLPRDFAPARVQPLAPERQKLLVRKLLGDTRAAPLIAALERTPALAEMGGNPLLLSLLALVAREAPVTDPRFPVRRTELYGTAVDLLLRRGYGVEPRDVWDPVLARDLLRRLSLDLQGEPGESWSRDHVYARTESVLLADPSLPPRVALGFRGSTDDLVTELGTNSGVLGDFEGPGEPWRYLHRSLREHLAAERLRDEGPARPGAAPRSRRSGPAPPRCTRARSRRGRPGTRGAGCAAGYPRCRRASAARLRHPPASRHVKCRTSVVLPAPGSPRITLRG